MRVYRTLPASRMAPSLAREALDRAGRVPEPAKQDLRLLISELVTNAVKHAGLRPGEPIELDVRTLPERAEVTVRYPEHEGFEAQNPPEPGEASRWGFLLVDRISDRWSVVEDRGHTAAWFELDLPRAS